MFLTRSQKAFDNLERKLELPMLFATLLLLGLIILRNSFLLDPSVLLIFDIAELSLWLLFFVELITMTMLSQDRFLYLKTHWYNIFTVLLPLLRIAALDQSAALFYLIGPLSYFYNVIFILFGADTLFVRIIPLIFRGLATMKVLFRRHRLDYIIYVIFIVVVFLGPLAAVFERNNPDANLRTVTDGIWWAFISMSTVGYGDFFPVTLQGRLIGLVVIVLGVTLFSLLTAHVSSIMVEDSENAERADIRQHLDAIEHTLEHLEEEIEEEHHPKYRKHPKS